MSTPGPAAAAAAPAPSSTAASAPPPPTTVQAAPAPAPISGANHAPDWKFRLPARYTLDFGRLDRDYFIIERTLSIDNQNTISGRTWDAMTNLTMIELPITRDNFIRMWKTLILKRCQDVFESEKCRRSDNFVRITRNIILPGPLADLLYSIGQYSDPVTGITYHMIPPARAAAPPPWWEVDGAILTAWNLTMARMDLLFQMKEFPPIRDYDSRPMSLVAIHDVNNMIREVKAQNNGPTPADGFIRFINDEIFVNPPDFDDCHLRMVEPINRISVIGDYLRDYCIGNNV